MISTMQTSWMGDVARMKKENANQFDAEILRGKDHLEDLERDLRYY